MNRNTRYLPMLGMALTLVNEQADEVVAKLYNDYCRNAGTK